MRHSKRLWQREEGFTLTEVLIVSALAVVVMAIGVPLLNTVQDHYGIVLAAQSVATQMQYARMKAVSSNEPFSVNFGASPTSYQVQAGFGGTVIAGPFSYPHGVSLNSTGTGAVTFPGGSVTFLPTGNVPATGNGSAGRVKLINQSGVMIDIVVTNGGIIRQTPAYTSLPPPF